MWQKLIIFKMKGLRNLKKLLLNLYFDYDNGYHLPPTSAFHVELKVVKVACHQMKDVITLKICLEMKICLAKYWDFGNFDNQPFSLKVGNFCYMGFLFAF